MTEDNYQPASEIAVPSGANDAEEVGRDGALNSSTLDSGEYPPVVKAAESSPIGQPEVDEIDYDAVVFTRLERARAIREVQHDSQMVDIEPPAGRIHHFKSDDGRTMRIVATPAGLAQVEVVRGEPDA